MSTTVVTEESIKIAQQKNWQFVWNRKPCT
jgi:hypothetical protein